MLAGSSIKDAKVGKKTTGYGNFTVKGKNNLGRAHYIRALRASCDEMLRTLSTLIFLSGIAVVFMGLTIMLIVDEYGTRPTMLVNATLTLNFAAGGILVFYMMRNKGIN